MPIQKNFIRKLWLDTRAGTALYLMLALQFLNFILIAYNYLIEGNTIFENLFFNLWFFGIIFLISYIPVSILIGRWHRQNQIRVDETLKYFQNPLFAKMFRTLLDTQTGRATKEEIEEFRKMLTKIEKRDIKEF
jgi:hypothetical protein